jgi:hypothetical protein
MKYNFFLVFLAGEGAEAVSRPRYEMLTSENTL